MLPNIKLLVRITTIKILVMTKDTSVEAEVTMLTTTVTGVIIDLIFEVLMSLQTLTRGKGIGNKINGIMALL